ncbi:MAG: PrsW family glutamic-type intramembrane protease [Candidatus Hodarchaeota archaeon]
MWNPFFWTLTQYLSPILFLGIWVPFAASFLDLEFDSISFKRTFPVIIFGSILVVFGALLLNKRLIFVILTAITSLFNMNAEIDQIGTFVVNELMIGIIGPANEELMKIIPIIVITNVSIVFFNPEVDDFKEFNTKSSIMSVRQLGLYGIISGTIFTFLELFLYQWQLTGSGSGNQEIFLQISLRTLAPIHVWTTFLMALGIASFKGRLAEHQTIKTAFFSCLGYFIIGWGFHAFWNSLNVYFNIFLPQEETILLLIVSTLGVLVNILLFFGIIFIFKTTPSLCSHCGYQEKGIHFHHIAKEPQSDIKQSRYEHVRSFVNLISHLRRNQLKKTLGCPFCFNPLILGTCSTCGARTFVICPQCNGFISETTRKCPHCNKKINPLTKLRNNVLSLPDTIILGVTSLSSIAFLLAPITILLFGEPDGYGGVIIPILVFYFIMSITTLLNVVIALFLNRTAGMLVLFCYFLEFVALIFTILSSLAIIGFLRAILTLDIIGLIIITLSGIIIFILGYRFVYTYYFNYSPIFSEYDLESIENMTLEEIL